MRCGHWATIGLLAFSCPELVHAQQAGAQAAPQPAAPPPSCDTPENRQFDFWVGAWDVYPAGTTQLVAHSLIEKLYAGCAIRENWMPLPGQGPGGGSLNNYDRGLRQWHQSWIDGSGARTEFSGGLQDGKMVLTGNRLGAVPPRDKELVRMTFSVLPDGSVRQFGERSLDGGKSWQARYDFTYRRSAASPSRN